MKLYKSKQIIDLIVKYYESCQAKEKWSLIDTLNRLSNSVDVTKDPRSSECGDNSFKFPAFLVSFLECVVVKLYYCAIVIVSRISEGEKSLILITILDGIIACRYIEIE